MVGALIVEYSEAYGSIEKRAFLIGNHLGTITLHTHTLFPGRFMQSSHKD
jgi:hypothetical protein